MFKDAAYFDTIRSTTPASIGATFATIGTPLTTQAVCLIFKNQTNGDVLVSTDGTNTMLAFPANSYTVYDIRTNAPRNTDLLFSIGTQFYVKDGTTASTTGTFYIEAVIVNQTGS